MTDSNLKKDRTRAILVNTFSNYAGKFITLTTWFFLTPFILHQLGDNHYGLWALVGSVVAYGTLLNFGIAGAVTKYVAEYRATNQIEQSQSLIATSLSLYLIIGLLIIIASAVLAPLFPLLFNVSPDDQSTAVWLVFLAGMGVGISIPCATPAAVLRGLQRFDVLNMISGGSTLLQAIAFVVVLLAGGGLLGLALAAIIVHLLTQIPAVWAIYRIAPELQFGWRGATLKSMRTVASFSWAMFVLNVGGHLEAKTDEIVIGAFSPIRAVSPYNIAQKLSTVPQIITEQFLSLILPIASELHAAKDFVRLRELYITSTRVTLAIMLPIAGCLIILAVPFLGAWVGKAYVTYANLVVILVLASLIDTMLWPAGFVLQGMTHHKFPALMALGSGVTNVLLSIFLVQRMGLTGVAIGTLIPTTIVAFVFVLPYAMHVIKVSFRVVLMQIFLSTLLPAIPMILVTYYLHQTYQPASFISLGLISGIGLLTYAVGYFLIGAGELERAALQDLKHVIRQLFQKCADHLV